MRLKKFHMENNIKTVMTGPTGPQIFMDNKYIKTLSGCGLTILRCTFKVMLMFWITLENMHVMCKFYTRLLKTKFLLDVIAEN